MQTVTRQTRQSTLALATAFLLVAAVGTPVDAQQPQQRRANGEVVPQAVDARAHATRAELEAAAVQAENASRQGKDQDLRRRNRTEADAMRTRLKSGDFLAGDRIVLVVRGDKALADTFTVRAGQMLRLPGMGDIPLAGVLRSELEPHLQKQLGRYIREPDFEATPLVRLGLFGQVQQPGFYWMPADVQLSDALMLAGGPTQSADLTRSSIKRNSVVLHQGKNARDVISAGRTLDQLNLRAGDEIVVGERRRRDWVNYLQAAGIIVGLVGVYAGTRG